MYPIPANATRIRYLESTGTQYIDTGVNQTTTTNVSGRFGLLSTYYSFIFGCGIAWGEDTLMMYIGNASGASLLFRVAGTQETIRQNVQSGDIVDFSLVGTTLTVDGNTWTFPSRTAVDNTIKIFAYGDGTTTGSNRVYAFRVYNDVVLVRDFIPVRVGQTGYLFDRVSGQLFGNAGSGSFVLGPDTFSQGVVPTRMMVGGVRKREPSTLDYVQSGLVGMWDGIENAGRGVHDSQARMIDLAGNHVPLAFSNASTDSDAIVLTASSYATLNANEWADIRTIFNSGNFTIQFCGEPSTGSNNWWTIMNSTPDSNYGRITVRPTFTTSSNLYKKFQAAVFGDSGATWGGTGPGMGLNANYNMPALFDGTPGSFRCASVICNSNGSASVVVNDTRFDFTTGSWPISTTRTGDMYFGHESSSAGNAAGKWHSIRIYNRALSASEVAANYAIDKARFNLP